MAKKQIVEEPGVFKTGLFFRRIRQALGDFPADSVAIILDSDKAGIKKYVLKYRLIGRRKDQSTTIQVP